MDTSKNCQFSWLRQEVSSIKSRRFHIFHPLDENSFAYVRGSRCVEIRGCYAEFLKVFGLAKLFTDYRDAPVLCVYPLEESRRQECRNGKSYVGFGYRGNKSFYFDEDEVFSQEEPRVFLIKGESAVETNFCFSDWLKKSYESTKEKYSRLAWEKIISGPKPFSQEEALIVDARKRFKWSVTGFTDNGDAIFKVENQSSITIPYLTIGIRDKAGVMLTGRVWLSIAHIGPGETASVTKDCYKNRIPPDELLPFDLSEPIPEKKDGYWEFGVASR